jgi:opacity protein-like surface antigen
MKKILAVLGLVAISTSALADPLQYYHGPHGGDPFHGGYHGGYYGGYRGYNHYENHYHSSGIDILAPMVIGGVIGYAINESNRQPAIYQQPTVIYQQPSTVYQKCTAWVESIDQYGNVTRTRTCY